MVRTATSKTNAAPQRRVGGQVPGAKQYHKPTLYDLVAQYRPISSVMWDLVAAQYRARTGELKVRDNVKRYFVQKCCNNNKKPTGQSAPDPFTEKCQNLWRSILASEDASDMGDSDSDEDFHDATVALGQFTQTQTQIDDSQDPEYRPSLEEELSSSSDSEESVMATPSSILSPSIATKKSRVTESIAGNKSKNNKHTVNQGKFHFFHYYLLFILYYILFTYIIFLL